MPADAAGPTGVSAQEEAMLAAADAAEPSSSFSAGYDSTDLLEDTDDVKRQKQRLEDALEVRRRMLDNDQSVLTRLAWLPEACGAVGLPINAANIKRRYKLLSVYVHPDKVAMLGDRTHLEDADEHAKWTEAYRRLRDARDTLLGAKAPAADEEDEEDEEAAAALAAGRVKDAETRYSTLSSTSRAELGRNHPRTVRTQRRLAEVLYHHTSRRGEAECIYRHLLGTSRTALGEYSVDYLRIAGGLGQVLHDKGDLAAAEPLLKQSADGLLALGLEHDEGTRTIRQAHATLTLSSAWCA